MFVTPNQLRDIITLAVESLSRTSLKVLGLGVVNLGKESEFQNFMS